MKVSQFYLQPPNTWKGGKRKSLKWKTCKHLRNSNFCLQWSNLLTHLVGRKVWKWHHTHHQGPQNSDRVKILKLYMGLYPISQLLSQCCCLGRSGFWSTEKADRPPPYWISQWMSPGEEQPPRASRGWDPHLPTPPKPPGLHSLKPAVNHAGKGWIYHGKINSVTQRAFPGLCREAALPTHPCTSSCGGSKMPFLSIFSLPL